MVEVQGVGALQNEIERVKSYLEETDETLRKMTGREPNDRFRRGGMRGGFGRGGRFMAGRGRGMGIGRGAGDTQAGPHRILGSAFSSISVRPGASSRRQRTPELVQEELPNKPSLMSAVTPADSRTRDEAIKEQNESQGRVGVSRNKRMFGLLLGTLQRFKKEEKTTFVDKERAQKEVERKLDVRAREEREEQRQERIQLLRTRRDQRRKIAYLHQKIAMVQQFEWWARETTKLSNFIRSQAKPYIFYSPRRHNSETERKREATATAIHNLVSNRRAVLETEIAQLTHHDGDDDDDHEEDEEEEDDDELEEEDQVDPTVGSDLLNDSSRANGLVDGRIKVERVDDGFDGPSHEARQAEKDKESRPPHRAAKRAVTKKEPSPSPRKRSRRRSSSVSSSSSSASSSSSSSSGSDSPSASSANSDEEAGSGSERSSGRAGRKRPDSRQERPVKSRRRRHSSSDRSRSSVSSSSSRDDRQHRKKRR